MTKYSKVYRTTYYIGRGVALNRIAHSTFNDKAKGGVFYLMSIIVIPGINKCVIFGEKTFEMRDVQREPSYVL